MTDRIRTLTVILDRDLRDEEESVGVVVNAIEMIKCVASVKLGPPTGIEQHIANDEFARKIGHLIREIVRTTPDADFMRGIDSVYYRLKAKRGY